MSVGGFIRRNAYWTVDIMKGSPIRKHYSNIKNVLNNHETIKSHQELYLTKLLEHATSYSKFYNICKSQKIEDYPVVNKQTLRDNYKKILVDIAHVPWQINEYHIQRTSGSTGTPLIVPQDVRKRNRVLAELKVFGEFAGYNSHEKLLHARILTRRHVKSRRQILRENIFPIDCTNIKDENFKIICDLIKKKNISAILGYSSWFDPFIEYIKKHSISINSIKAVIAGSEFLPPETRQKIITTLSCNVVSRYSNEEQGILAQEGINNDFFSLNHASYYFEFLKLDSDEHAMPGEVSRIVITDLFNYAFPLIRYDTGDTGVFSYQSDDKITIIKQIYGRLIDLLYDTDGHPIHPMILSRIIKYYDEIREWQFIQKDYNYFVLKLKVSSPFEYSECVNQIKSKIGENSEINVEVVDEIPLLSSGKRKPIICELKR